MVSQPFFVLAFHPHNFWEELTSWNIFVTLFFSLLAIYGVKERKWWWFLLRVLAINVLNADYANTGVILTLIFYLCRNKPLAGGAALCAELPPGSLGQVPGGPNGPGGGGDTPSALRSLPSCPHR